MKCLSGQFWTLPPRLRRNSVTECLRTRDNTNFLPLIWIENSRNVRAKRRSELLWDVNYRGRPALAGRDGRVRRHEGKRGTSNSNSNRMATLRKKRGQRPSLFICLPTVGHVRTRCRLNSNILPSTVPSSDERATSSPEWTYPAYAICGSCVVAWYMCVAVAVHRTRLQVQPSGVSSNDYIFRKVPQCVRINVGKMLEVREWSDNYLAYKIKRKFWKCGDLFLNIVSF